MKGGKNWGTPAVLRWKNRVAKKPTIEEKSDFSLGSLKGTVKRQVKTLTEKRGGEKITAEIRGVKTRIGSGGVVLRSSNRRGNEGESRARSLKRIRTIRNQVPKLANLEKGKKGHAGGGRRKKETDRTEFIKNSIREVVARAASGKEREGTVALRPWVGVEGGFATMGEITRLSSTLDTLPIA